MNRRSFIRIGMAGAATGIIMPQAVLASASNQKLLSNKMAGGVFYTKEFPGRWKKKAGSHSPIMEKAGDSVRIVTGHPMKANDHWIIKHVLLDSDFNFVTEHVFDPNQDKAAISSFSLAGQKDVVYGLSVCNKHDTWLTVLEI